MAGKFVIRLQQGQNALQIQSIGPDGTITLQNEFDPLPRKLRIALLPKGGVTKKRIQKIISDNLWNGYQFQLVLDENGNLVCKTDDPKDMPEGDYLIGLWIEDLQLPALPFSLRLRKKGDVAVSIGMDSREISVRDAYRIACDEDIKRVLERSDKSENLALFEWLADARPRKQRRACLFNLLSVLRTSPNAGNPFLPLVERIFKILPDRIYAEVSPELHRRIAELVKTTNFYSEGKPSSPVHKNVILAAGKNPDDYDLRSFRQEGRPSMQICLAMPKADSEHSLHLADIDLDLANPLQDIVGFIAHMAELFSKGKTDHLGLHKKLAIPPTDEYLYYDVVKH